MTLYIYLTAAVAALIIFALIAGICAAFGEGELRAHSAAKLTVLCLILAFVCLAAAGLMADMANLPKCETCGHVLTKEVKP